MTDDDISDMVDHWFTCHGRPHGEPEGLRAFLGLTEAEFIAWAVRGKSKPNEIDVKEPDEHRS